MGTVIKIPKSTWDSMHQDERNKYIYCPSQESAYVIDPDDPRDRALIEFYSKDTKSRYDLGSWGGDSPLPGRCNPFF